jgi:hypothetical protein
VPSSLQPLVGSGSKYHRVGCVHLLILSSTLRSRTDCQNSSFVTIDAMPVCARLDLLFRVSQGGLDSKIKISETGRSLYNLPSTKVTKLPTDP